MSEEESATAAVFPPVLRTPFVFGASTIGPLHIQKGLPCQDACGFEVIAAKFLIVAVADGLGSAAHSDRGAAAAVQAALDSLRQGLEGGASNGEQLRRLVGEAVGAARKILEQISVLEKCQLRELACTLIVLVATADSLSVAHIGDGAVIAETEHGLELASGPADSEYVNEVVPLTSRSWEAALRVAPVVTGARSVIVLTDGCQRAALKREGESLLPYEGFFMPLISYAEDLKDIVQGTVDLANLLASTKLSENSEDDKTLVIGMLARARRSL